MIHLHAIIGVSALIFLNLNFTEGQQLVLDTDKLKVTKGDKTVLTCQIHANEQIPDIILFERKKQGMSNFEQICKTVRKNIKSEERCLPEPIVKGYECKCPTTKTTLIKDVAVVVFRVSLEDEATWHCTTPGGIPSNSLNLIVLYPPTSDPIIRRYKTYEIIGEHIDISVNSFIILSCSITEGKPFVTCSDMKNDYVKTLMIVVDESYVTVIFVLKGLIELHNKTCSCSATHITGRYHGKTSFTVFVLNFLSAKIDVKLGLNKKCTLTCIVTHYPADSNFTISDSFTQKYMLNTIRTLPGIRRSNTLVAIIQPYGIDDLGYYTCNASNSVYNIQAVAVPDLDIKPILLDHPSNPQMIISKVGTRFNLSKTIRPSWRSLVGFYWLSPAHKFMTYKKREVNIQLTVHGKLLYLQAVQVSILIDQLTDVDFGQYTFHVCDNHSCGEFYTILQNESISSATTAITSVETNKPNTPERQTGSMALGIGILVVLIMVATIPAGWFIYKRLANSKEDVDNSLQLDKLVERKDFTDVIRDQVEKQPEDTVNS